MSSGDRIPPYITNSDKRTQQQQATNPHSNASSAKSNARLAAADVKSPLANARAAADEKSAAVSGRYAGHVVTPPPSSSSSLLSSIKKAPSRHDLRNISKAEEIPALDVSKPPTLNIEDSMERGSKRGSGASMSTNSYSSAGGAFKQGANALFSRLKNVVEKADHYLESSAHSEVYAASTPRANNSGGDGGVGGTKMNGFSSPRSDMRALTNAMFEEKMISKLVDEYNENYLGESKKGERCEGLFAENLVYSVDSVEVQIENGLEMTYRMHKVLDKYIKLQRSFGEALHELYSHENRKVAFMNPGDRLSSLNQAEIALLESIRSAADGHLFHAKNLEDHALRTSSAVYTQYSRQSKEAVARKKSLSEEINISKNALAKSKNKTLRLLTAADEKDKEVDIKKVINLARVAADSKFCNSGSALVERAYTAVLDYEEALGNSRTFIQNIVSSSFPAVLESMQQCEDFRYFGTTKGLQEYAKSTDLLSQAYKNVAETMKEVVGKANLKKDFTSFTTACTSYADIDKYTLSYDLPLTLKDLQQQITDPVQKQNLGIGRFQMISLTTAMDMQKKEYPSLKLPLVFIRLRAAIGEANGWKTEGIFRLSANQKEIEDYVEFIKENKELSNPKLVPHIPACALKQWLRELDAPVIPSNFYDEALRLGNSTDPKDKSVVASIHKLVNNLPGPNKAIIHGLAHIAQLVSSKGYVEVTKMTISNLAIVFSPCILRTAESPDLEVNLTMLAANSRGEITFTGSLLQYLEVDQNLIHLNFDITQLERKAKD